MTIEPPPDSAGPSIPAAPTQTTPTDGKIEVSPGCALGCFWISVVVIFLGTVFLFNGFDVQLHLLFGFLFFITHSLQQIRPNFAAITTLLTGAFAFLIITHLLVRRLIHPSSPACRWKFQHTCLSFSAVLISFVAGLSFIGTLSNTGWLFSQPVFKSLRIPVLRTISRDRLHNIGLALHNYHDRAQRFPPGATLLAEGVPGHSWMTALLPWLDQAALYKSIRQDRSWLASENKAPLSNKIDVLQYFAPDVDLPAKDSRGYALTHYAGNLHVFPSEQGISLDDVKDGPSNTIFAGEVLHHLKPWGDPTNLRDPMLGINKSPHGFECTWGSGAQFLLMDGSARIITEKVDPKILRALSLPNDGQTIGKY